MVWAMSLHEIRRSIALVLVALILPFAPIPTMGAEEYLLPFIELRPEYNDNVFFDDTDKESDFITTVSPGLTWMYRTSRLDVNVIGRLDRLEYAENDDLSNWDGFAGGTLRYAMFPRMNVFADAGYREDSRPDRDLTATGLLLTPTDRVTKHYGAGGDYAIDQWTMASFSYFYQQDDYDDPQIADARVHSIRAGLTHEITQRVTGKTDIGVDQYRFDGSDIGNYFGTVGAVYRFTELFSLEANVGVRFTQPDFDATRTGENDKDNWGGMAEFVFSYDGELTDLSARISHGVIYAAGREGLTENTGVTLNAAHRLTYEFLVYLVAGYYWNTADEGRLASTDLNEETLYVNSAVSYNFTNDISLELSYSYVRIDDNQADREADRNLVFLWLRIQYPLFQ
jgi:hypothetical protein